MKRIILGLVIIVIMPLCTSACYNYRDINRTIFVTTALIDIDSSNNTVLYVETFTPSRGEQVEVGQERKTTFQSGGKSLFDAARNLSLMSNYKFSYSQCRAIIFTTKAAKYGLDNFLDLFTRSQSLPLRSYIFITLEDVENIMNAQMDEEKYIGIFLSELAQNTDLSSKGTVLRIDEFFNKRTLESKVNLVNVIMLSKEQKAPRFQIVGLAVIKDDRLMDMLNFEQSMAYNFINNTFKQGVINISNPEHEDKVATIEVLKSKTKSKINLDKDKIYLKKKIESKASFAFSEKSIHITNPEQRNELEKSSEAYIKRICMELFNEYKQKDIDIFNLKRELQMKYPRTKVNNCLENTDLELDLNVNLKGSTENTNFE